MAAKLKKISSGNVTQAVTEIVVDDGRRRVPIKNTLGEEIGSFVFSPTDIDIIERYNDSIEKFEEVSKIIEENWVDDDADQNDETIKKNLEAFKKGRERLNELVDYIFGGNASEAFFGKMNPFSPVGGRFYAEVAIEAAGNYIGSQFDAADAAMSERAEQYLRDTK